MRAFALVSALLLAAGSHALGQDACADRQLVCLTQCANGLMSLHDRCLAGCKGARDSCAARALGPRAEADKSRTSSARLEKPVSAAKRSRSDDPARYRR